MNKKSYSHSHTGFYKLIMIQDPSNGLETNLCKYRYNFREILIIVAQKFPIIPEIRHGQYRKLSVRQTETKFSKKSVIKIKTVNKKIWHPHLSTIEQSWS